MQQIVHKLPHPTNWYLTFHLCCRFRETVTAVFDSNFILKKFKATDGVELPFWFFLLALEYKAIKEMEEGIDCHN